MTMIHLPRPCSKCKQVFGHDLYCPSHPENRKHLEKDKK